MICLTTSATLSRNTSTCSDRMISSTAPRAAVILWPSAIVVLLRQFVAEPTIMKFAVADQRPDPARLLHHFYRLDRPSVRTAEIVGPAGCSRSRITASSRLSCPRCITVTAASTADPKAGKGSDVYRLATEPMNIDLWRQSIDPGPNSALAPDRIVEELAARQGARHRVI
jgi:hypothetical protein